MKSFFTRLKEYEEKKRSAEANEEVSVDMSSLVDLSFLLLVFFLVTTTLISKERDLPMALPSDGALESIQLPPLIIRVETDNRVLLHPGQSFEEQVVSADEGHELVELKERLTLLKSVKQGVQVDVKDGSSYQRFMDVLNCLRGAGWDQVGITYLN